MAETTAKQKAMESHNPTCVLNLVAGLVSLGLLGPLREAFNGTRKSLWLQVNQRYPPPMTLLEHRSSIRRNPSVS